MGRAEFRCGPICGPVPGGRGEVGALTALGSAGLNFDFLRLLTPAQRSAFHTVPAALLGLIKALVRFFDELIRRRVLGALFHAGDPEAGGNLQLPAVILHL